MNEKLNSKEILEQFVQRSGLSEEQSKNFIDTFQYVFLQAIEKDKIVKISGLGTFQLVWNKPRKSVDVRTQQEIEIAGHYKLTFTPENALKERVNAEFAHLEIKEIELPQSKKESPIEKLSQQAKELKEIIDGIQQNKNKIETENIPSEQEEVVVTQEIEEIKKVELVEQIDEIPEYPEIQEVEEVEKFEEVVEEIIEDPKVEKVELVEEIVEEKIEETVVEEPNTSTSLSNQEEIVITEELSTEQPAETEVELDEKELAQKQSAIDFFYQKPEPPIEVKANTFNYIENYEFEPKKRRCWLWWLIIFAVLAALLAAFYFLCPKMAKECWNITNNKATELTQKIGGWFSKSQSADIEEDNIPADTVKVDLDTTVQPVETPKTPKVSIFDEPRTYTEFITSVRMYGGNTLVKLAEEYYGHKMFWVYIYEANKNKIDDPDKIPGGQIMKVPKLNEKLIDLNNPACLEYAINLHHQYLKK